MLTGIVRQGILLIKPMVLPLQFPVETIALFIVLSCISYLSLVLSPASTTIPLLSFSNGSLYTLNPTVKNSRSSVVYLKQVVVSLPKTVQSIDASILSPPIIDSLASLQHAIVDDLYLVEGDKKLYYRDLCWRQSGGCALYSPKEVLFASYPTLDPIESIAAALEKDAAQVEYGLEGLVRRECLDQDASCVEMRAKSIVMTVFFNYTTAGQQNLVHRWEKRLESLRFDHFYSPDLSLYFEKVTPEGHVDYDLLDSMSQIKELLRVSILWLT
ncbi:hypothetical protein HDU91_002726 [Kappamyces sp. JEL0680]|nr:hypothetical protein HDU91_002726 [Kappamyces sp. JEL0680]